MGEIVSAATLRFTQRLYLKANRHVTACSYRCKLENWSLLHSA